MLVFEELADAGEGVNLTYWFVRAEAEDTREAQGVSTLVAVGFHHIVEGDFEDNVRFDEDAVSAIFDGVLLEPLSEFGDLDVSQARVGFADIEKAGAGFALADGEGVIAQDGGALAVSVLDAGNDYVEGSE